MSYLIRAATIAAACVCAVAGATDGANALGVTTLPAPITEPLPPVAQPEIAPGDGIATDTPAQTQLKPTLVALVQANDDATGDAEIACLATAVYFEAKGEPLAGQLAVAEVILNRVHSGRFASTVCGVVKQPSQFSFVHHGAMPAMGNSAQWRTATGVARVAFGELYTGPAPQAMYFHARRVAPNWGKREVAAVGNHIFYR